MYSATAYSIKRLLEKKKMRKLPEKVVTEKLPDGVNFTERLKRLKPIREFSFNC